jgi:hypothetical protein
MYRSEKLNWYSDLVYSREKNKDHPPDWCAPPPLPPHEYTVPTSAGYCVWDTPRVPPWRILFPIYPNTKQYSRRGMCNQQEKSIRLETLCDVLTWVEPDELRLMKTFLCFSLIAELTIWTRSHKRFKGIIVHPHNSVETLECCFPGFGCERGETMKFFKHIVLNIC